MNTETGQIHEMLPDETLRTLAERLQVAESKLIELKNAPIQECPNCSGTGIYRITVGGVHIPCKCTNPK